MFTCWGNKSYDIYETMFVNNRIVKSAVQSWRISHIIHVYEKKKRFRKNHNSIMLKKDIHPGPEPVSVWKCEEESGWLSTTYNGCYKKKVGADVITIVTTCLRYFAISEMGKIVSPGQKFKKKSCDHYCGEIFATLASISHSKLKHFRYMILQCPIRVVVCHR